MTPDATVALITAIGAVVAAAATAVAQFAGSRGPLNRIEALTRILREIAPDESSRTDLETLRRIEIEELLRARKSPERAIFGISITSLLAAAVLIGAGDQLRAWSPALYLLAFWLFAGLASLLLAMYVAVGVVFVARVIRWFKARRRDLGSSKRRDQREDQSA